VSGAAEPSGRVVTSCAVRSGAVSSVAVTAGVSLAPELGAAAPDTVKPA